MNDTDRFSVEARELMFEGFRLRTPCDQLSEQIAARTGQRFESTSKKQRKILKATQNKENTDIWRLQQRLSEYLPVTLGRFAKKS